MNTNVSKIDAPSLLLVLEMRSSAPTLCDWGIGVQMAGIDGGRGDVGVDWSCFVRFWEYDFSPLAPFSKLNTHIAKASQHFPQQ